MLEPSELLNAGDSKKSHSCTFNCCEAAYSRKWKLIVHMRKHTGERPFACDIPGCNKTFTNTAHLKRHTVLSHEKFDELKCENCQKIFNNRYSLKRHQHNKCGPRICGDCGETFDKEKQFQEHLLLHSDIKPFRCEDCNVYFSAAWKYETHVRKHKTYECTCGEKFHKWTLFCAHKKEVCKPVIKCEICEKVFTLQSKLKTHVLTHEDERSRVTFDCPYEDCERIYYYKKNLDTHIRQFHLKIKNLEKCPFMNCEADLSSRGALKRHIELIHLKKEQNLHDSI